MVDHKVTNTITLLVYTTFVNHQFKNKKKEAKIKCGFGTVDNGERERWHVNKGID